MDYSAFNAIKAFVFDVDGVFTNSDVIVMENGDLLRTMSTRDGQAVKYAIESGYHVAVITKGLSTGVRKRFEMLGVEDIYDRLHEKIHAFEDFKQKHQLSKDEILYMGDDLPDLPIFPLVGIASCPFDAVPEVLKCVDYISSVNGGSGCVRDVIEKVMRIQSMWPGMND